MTRYQIRPWTRLPSGEKEFAKDPVRIRTLCVVCCALVLGWVVGGRACARASIVTLVQGRSSHLIRDIPCGVGVAVSGV